MRVVIAGGHGKIALLLERLLTGRGDQAVGLIRNPAHVADVQGAGAEAVVCDLEAASAGDVAVLLSKGPSRYRSLGGQLHMRQTGLHIYASRSGTENARTCRMVRFRRYERSTA